MIAHILDVRLVDLAKKNGVTYSRHADEPIEQCREPGLEGHAMELAVGIRCQSTAPVGQNGSMNKLQSLRRMVENFGSGELKADSYNLDALAEYGIIKGHLVARNVTNLSGDLAKLGDLDMPFPLPYGRGDEAHHGGGPNPRDARPKSEERMPPARDIYVPDLHIDSIRVKARNFR